MVDMAVARFYERALGGGEPKRQLSYTHNMLLATVAASFAILGAGAFFLSLWF
jgi:hypothetical protein